MKNIIYLILIFIFTNITMYIRKVDEVYSKLNQFYLCLDENIKYQDSDDFLIVFNYEEIEKSIDKIFEDYEVSIVKTSLTSFRLEVQIKEALLENLIMEKYYLKKGENYEKFN